MKLHILHDPVKIRQLLTKDNLFDSLSDKKVTIDKWMPDLKNQAWFKVDNEDKTIGVCMVQYIAGNVMNFHGGLYKDCRHKDTVNLTKQCLDVLKGLFKCKFIFTVPSDHLVMIKLAQKLGYTQSMRIKHGSTNNHDLLIFGEE